MRLVLGIVLALLCAVTGLTLWYLHNERVNDAARRIDDEVRRVFRDEETRPAAHYQSYPYLEQEAYSRGFQKLQKQQVKVPSPLMAKKPRFVRLHFQIDHEQQYGSPQAPVGSEGEIAARDGVLTEAQQRKEHELLARVQNLVKPQPAGTDLEGHWVDGELFLLRQRGKLLQGIWVDWPALKKHLLATAGSDLVPGSQLLTLPVDVKVSGFRWSWTYLLLLGMWVAVLFAVYRQFAVLREQRRFSRSVTHELRGPLTTFQLYHELLDEGLVAEEKKAGYYKTLREESKRMGHLVDNVIAHAQVERGTKLQLQTLPLADAVQRALPAGAEVATDLDAAEGIDVEVDAVALGQILENLVSNAEKYGQPPFALAVRPMGKQVEIRFSDTGEGRTATPSSRSSAASTRARRCAGSAWACRSPAAWPARWAATCATRRPRPSWSACPWR